MTIEQYQSGEFVYRLLVRITNKNGDTNILRIFPSHSYRKARLCKGAMSSRLKYYNTSCVSLGIIEQEIITLDDSNIEWMNNPGFMPTRVMLPSELTK